MDAALRQRIRDHLLFLYGAGRTPAILERLEAMLDDFRRRNPHLSQRVRPFQERLTQRDAMLITYGDQIREPQRPPLETLDEVLTVRAGDVLSAVHILPFYPYSSDDGFSVIDYKAVNPELGTWEHIHLLATHFRLMFDAVINHISRRSAWFQAFLRGEAPYTDYFIVVDPNTDLSQVVRPRTTPLLTPVETVDGIKYVWTTFSADQIDLNYANPQVLLDIIDVLLFYVENGAQFIRLDAVAFLWKEIGTSCLHLPQTHRVIQLFRAVLDAVAPEVMLITETNVPHAENITYFGDGYNEAQLVYNFSLPPLTLHAFATGDATVLQRWAATLRTPSDHTTWFNFLASHDGIGVRPAEGILSSEEIQALCERTVRHGGFVSYRSAPDGSQLPYELNITYYDALNDPNSHEPQSIQVDRFMASQAILVSMAGLPGIYAHSLFGSRNWREGVAQTGHYRTINRQKLDRATLEAELDDPNHRRHQVFQRYRQLLAVRQAEPAFHPLAPQTVLPLHPAVFSFLRTALDGVSQVLCLHNVSQTRLDLEIRVDELDWFPGDPVQDLLAPAESLVVPASGRLRIEMPAYGVRWLRRAAAR